MNFWTIYQHKFPNGKSYIGKTSKPLQIRWGLNGNNYRENQPLIHNAIKKYGWDNIDHIILEENLTAEEADIKEQEYIEKFHSYYLDELGPGYNMTRGGEGGSRLDINKIEQLYKQGKNTYKIADELKINRSSAANILKKLGYDLSKNNYKMVSQFTLDGEYIASYESAREAERITGVDYKLISGVLRGITKSSNGYQWRYYTDDDIFGILPISRKKGGLPEKRIAQYDMNDNLLQIFDSVADAAKSVNRTRSNIRCAAQGKYKSSAGYKWKFVDENNVN